MPNHITNVIEIMDLGGADLKAVRKSFLNEKNQVDFSVIHSIPECLKDFEPHSGITGIAESIIGIFQMFSSKTDMFEYINKMSDADWVLVKRAVSNYHTCGYMYWYDWNSANWGTKWNAYNQPDDGYQEGSVKYQFDTAWCHPFELIKTISKNNPIVTFNISYADEDLGGNVGTYTIKDGVLSKENIAPKYRDMSQEQKKYFMEIAFHIKYEGEDPKSHGYNENWEYSDEIYEAYEANK